MRSWISALVETLDRRIGARLDAPLFQRDPALIARLGPLAETLELYSSVELRGWDNLPTRGPFLVVGNHSSSPRWSSTAPMIRWSVHAAAGSPPRRCLGES